MLPRSDAAARAAAVLSIATWMGAVASITASGRLVRPRIGGVACGVGGVVHAIGCVAAAITTDQTRTRLGAVASAVAGAALTVRYVRLLAFHPHRR